VYQASTPPDPAVNSTVAFCRACSSGRVENSTLMPVSFSNSGSRLSIVSVQGSFVSKT
jgi:hypothetical protein